MSGPQDDSYLGGSLENELEILAQLPDWEWPKGSTATVLAGLDSESAEIRCAALDLVSSVMSDEVASAVLEILEHDPDELARSRAAIAFGPMLEEMGAEEGFAEMEAEGVDLGILSGAETVVSPACFRRVENRLEQLYRDGTTPKLVRRRCLEAAVRSPRPWLEGPVRAAWNTDDEPWRLTAVFCMGFLPGFDAELVEALGLESEKLRLEAVRSVGQAGLDAAGRTVAAHAADPKTPLDLRIAAIAALGTVDAPGRLEILWKIRDGDDDELAQVADDALDELALLHEADRIWNADELDEDDPFP